MCRRTPQSSTFSSIFTTLARLTRGTLLFLCASVLWGQGAAEVPGSGSQAKAATTLLVNAREYIISPDDVLEIYILDVPELSRAYRVNQSGQIMFPLLPRPLHAAGLTLEGFSIVLASELKSSGTISDPHISVSVKESRLHSISITGAVKNPQVYPLLVPSKLLSVLSLAGGVSDDAGSILKVTRGGALNGNLSAASANPTSPQGDAPQTVTINLNELFNSGNPSLNIDIFPGDWINVPGAGVIYVVGAVNRPGGYVLNTSREHLSVLQLVALAEDLKPTAKRDHAMIIRRQSTPGAERQEIKVDLKKILAGTSADVPLEGNDILFVPDSAGKKALRRGAEAAIQIATGLALFRF